MSEKKEKENISLGFLLSAGLFAIITILRIVSDKETFKMVKELLGSKFFLISMLMVIVFSVYSLSLKSENDEIENLQLAVKHAILGLLIAILAKIDLVIAPFWLIFLASYYLGMG
jgi:amino acid permease